MSAMNKPVWLEGMFVRPQHFQQFDRWVESEIDRRVAGLVSYGWGFRRLELDDAALSMGRVAVQAIEAIMPDGTVVSIPEQAPPPVSRTLNASATGKLLKLAIVIRRNELGDFSTLDQPNAERRFATTSRQTRDASAPARDPVEVRIASLQTMLIVEGEPEDDRVTLPIGRVREVTPAGAIILSPTYVPPLMTIATSRAFQALLHETQVLLKSRADAIAGRLDPSRAAADAAGMLDLMTLSIINGREALLAHFADSGVSHPEPIYRVLVELVGSLCAFDAAKRRPPAFPPYRHDDIEMSFTPVIGSLRELLSVVYEERAVAIPLQKRSFGVWVGTVADRTLYDDARFVLVATAAVPSETLRAQLPVQTKVSPVETIRELVNLQLPGVPLKVLPVAPREIPFLRNAVYFDLEQSGDLWRRMPGSAAFALHSSGDYPELNFELWAIRNG